MYIDMRQKKSALCLKHSEKHPAKFIANYDSRVFTSDRYAGGAYTNLGCCRYEIAFRIYEISTYCVPYMLRHILSLQPNTNRSIHTSRQII